MVYASECVKFAKPVSAVKNTLETSPSRLNERANGETRRVIRMAGESPAKVQDGLLYTFRRCPYAMRARLALAVVELLLGKLLALTLRRELWFALEVLPRGLRQMRRLHT